MDKSTFDMPDIDIAWCPGCGDFSILAALKEALAELEVKPEELVIVSGIGQAAKLPHYLRTHFFMGLHGRALSVATMVKAVNPELTVIAESGDGCTYAEGGNHFLHTIRRNPDIAHIVHNNMVYGLTKGQASPTSQRGFKTPIQAQGVFAEPFNPIAVAIALDASFVARAYAGDTELTREILKKAIRHRGYSLVDILQPCPSFNRSNTYQWYRENTYHLEESYSPSDRVEAFGRAAEEGRMGLGIFYVNPDKPTFEESLPVYRDTREPLHMREVDFRKLSELIESERES